MLSGTTDSASPEFSKASCQHLRFRARARSFWDLPADDFVVVTVEPLLVLAGTGNDTACSVEGYGHILFVTWGHDCQSSPTWLPQLMLWLAHAAMLAHGVARCDVIALSRGVQALPSAAVPRQLLSPRARRTSHAPLAV